MNINNQYYCQIACKRNLQFREAFKIFLLSFKKSIFLIKKEVLYFEKYPVFKKSTFLIKNCNISTLHMYEKVLHCLHAPNQFLKNSNIFHNFSTYFDAGQSADFLS